MKGTMKGKIMKWVLALATVVFVYTQCVSTAIAADISANNSNSDSQYSNDWHYWSQGASKYSDMRQCGCHVVAYAKLLKEANCFALTNPDDFYEWSLSNGYYTSEFYEKNPIGKSVTDYIKTQNGESSVEKIALSRDKVQDSNLIMAFVRQGKYVVLGTTAHFTYVARDKSLEQGRAVISESWTPYSYKENSMIPYSSYSYHTFDYAYVYNINVNTYNVKFDSNGGTGTMDIQKHRVDEEKALPLNSFSKKGYQFVGWKDEKGTLYSDGVTVKNIARKGETKILYAQWKKVQYSITYNLNGGKLNKKNPSNYTVTSATITLNNPTKKHYKFVGWYDSNGVKYEEIITGTVGNIKLKAKWIGPDYSVKFNANGGTGKMENQKLMGETRSNLRRCGFSKKGYEFAGWTTKKDGSGRKYKNGASVINLSKKAGDTVVLFAQWKPKTYKISYDLNCGKNNKTNPSSYKYGKVVKFQGATRKGYTFRGWYKEKKLKTKIEEVKKGSTGNLVLYAKWTANKYGIKFDGNNASGGSTQKMSCYYGKKYTLAQNGFVRKGYNFSGWNTKKDGSGKKFSDLDTIKNLTASKGKTVVLYAQWEKIGKKKIGTVTIKDILVNKTTGETYDIKDSDQARQYYQYIYPETKYVFTQNKALVSLGAKSDTPKISGVYNGKKNINITFKYYLSDEQYQYVKSELTCYYNGSVYTNYMINTARYYDVTAIDRKGKPIEGIQLKWTRYYESDIPMSYELESKTSKNGYAYIGYPDGDSQIAYLQAQYGYIPHSNKKDENGNSIGLMYADYTKPSAEPLRIYDGKNKLIATVKPKKEYMSGYGQSFILLDESNFEIKYSQKNYKINITNDRKKAKHAYSAKQLESWQTNKDLQGCYITITKQ